MKKLMLAALTVAPLAIAFACAPASAGTVACKTDVYKNQTGGVKGALAYRIEFAD